MKILLAIDGSPCSDIAMTEVAQLLLPAGTIVHVVTVGAPVEPSLIGSLPTTFDELVKQQRAEAAKFLNEAVGSLRRLAPNLTVLPRLLEGNPKDVLIGEAERWGADLIVVGSHGYGPIRRFFLGSVSLFVAHHAPCSVLIARRKAENSPIPGAPSP